MKSRLLTLLILTTLVKILTFPSLYGQVLVPYAVGEKFGYSDVEGNIVIEPIYEKVSPFGCFNFVDESARCEIEEIDSITRSYAYVQRNGLNNIINTNGKEILKSEEGYRYYMRSLGVVDYDPGFSSNNYYKHPFYKYIKRSDNLVCILDTRTNKTSDFIYSIDDYSQSQKIRPINFKNGVLKLERINDKSKTDIYTLEGDFYANIGQFETTDSTVTFLDGMTNDRIQINYESLDTEVNSGELTMTNEINFLGESFFKFKGKNTFNNSNIIGLADDRSNILINPNYNEILPWGNLLIAIDTLSKDSPKVDVFDSFGQKLNSLYGVYIEWFNLDENASQYLNLFDRINDQILTYNRLGRLIAKTPWNDYQQEIDTNSWDYNGMIQQYNSTPFYLSVDEESEKISLLNSDGDIILPYFRIDPQTPFFISPLANQKYMVYSEFEEIYIIDNKGKQLNELHFTKSIFAIDQLSLELENENIFLISFGDRYDGEYDFVLCNFETGVLYKR